MSYVVLDMFIIRDHARLVPLLIVTVVHARQTIKTNVILVLLDTIQIEEVNTNHGIIPIYHTVSAQYALNTIANAQAAHMSAIHLLVILVALDII